MKNCILLHLFVLIAFPSFSQIVQITNDNSNDFSIALSDYYLSFNKFNSETLNEEVYVYDIYDDTLAYLVSDADASYLCDIGDYDYILYSADYYTTRELYVYDAYADEYYFIDTSVNFDFAKIYSNQILYSKIPDGEVDTHVYLNTGSTTLDLGIYNENLGSSDQADNRSVWAGSNMYYYDGSDVYQMNDEDEAPQKCMISNEAAAWVSRVPATGDVFVHYIDGSSDEIINPDGYGNWEWADLSGRNLVWLDGRPSGGVYWYDGITNTKIWNPSLPGASNCSIDENNIVFGGYDVIYHFDIDTYILKTYELGENRVASNLTVNNGAIAWTEYSSEYREVFFAFLDDLTVLNERALSAEQHSIEQQFIYPNPSKNSIKFNGTLSGDQAFKIADITGKIVISGLLDSNGEINIKELSPGAYFFKLEEKTFKFIKE